MSQYAWTTGWEEEFFNCLGQDSQEGEAAEDDDSDESGPLEANPKVKGYKEAISSLEEVQLNRGCTQESLQLGTESSKFTK